MGVAEIDEGVGVLPRHLDVPRHLEPEQPLENVFDEVRGDHGRQVPVQAGQKQEFPFLKQENKLQSGALGI